MKVTTQEEHQYNIMQMLSDALHNITSVEGEIEKIVRYGNSVIIRFKNGVK